MKLVKRLKTGQRPLHGIPERWPWLYVSPVSLTSSHSARIKARGG